MKIQIKIERIEPNNYFNQNLLKKIDDFTPLKLIKT